MVILGGQSWNWQHGQSYLRPRRLLSRTVAMGNVSEAKWGRSCRKRDGAHMPKKAGRFKRSLIYMGHSPAHGWEVVCRTHLETCFTTKLLSFRQISQILGTWFLYKEEEDDTVTLKAPGYDVMRELEVDMVHTVWGPAAHQLSLSSSPSTWVFHTSGMSVARSICTEHNKCRRAVCTDVHEGRLAFTHEL